MHWHCITCHSSSALSPRPWSWYHSHLSVSSRCNHFHTARDLLYNLAGFIVKNNKGHMAEETFRKSTHKYSNIMINHESNYHVMDFTSSVGFELAFVPQCRKCLERRWGAMRGVPMLWPRKFSTIKIRKCCHKTAETKYEMSTAQILTFGLDYRLFFFCSSGTDSGGWEIVSKC